MSSRAIDFHEREGCRLKSTKSQLSPWLVGLFADSLCIVLGPAADDQRRCLRAHLSSSAARQLPTSGHTSWRVQLAATRLLAAERRSGPGPAFQKIGAATGFAGAAFSPADK